MMERERWLDLLVGMRKLRGGKANRGSMVDTGKSVGLFGWNSERKKMNCFDRKFNAGSVPYHIFIRCKRLSKLI